jgi:Methyltransferase domain
MRMASGTAETGMALPVKGRIAGFAHSGDRPDSAHPMTPMEQLFWSNEGPVVHKWHHYLPIYDRYLTPWQGRPVRMLEIGVSRGGSMGMWRKFLGPEAVLFGIDIDPDCARFDGQAANVRIGSQTDAAFLQDVVAEMGGLDIVLDDGSHVSQHIRASLDVLFPLLSDGGTYIVEDLHTSYWRAYGGGFGKPGTFIEDVKSLIDDMHHWYHDRGQQVAATSGHIGAIHVYDSLVVLEKIAVAPPRHSQRGSE